MNGFEMFGVIHWAWLMFIIVGLFFTIYLYSRFSMRKRHSMQKLLFFTLLSLELSKQLFLLSTNSYNYWSIPLHLCGMGIFIIGWHVYRPNAVTAEILYALTLPGALAALILPGWTNEPIFGFIHFNSFILHFLLVAYVMMLLGAKEIQPNVKNVKYAVAFLLLTTPLVYLYNARFDTNFMFINWPLPGTPLALFESWLGNPGYLLGFAGLVCILWAFMYWPFYRKKTFTSA